jgi:hypothetical protein
MKTFFICFLIFSMVVLNTNTQVDGRILYENMPMNARGNRSPASKGRDEASKYNRGCSHINRCRGNDDD